MKKPRRATVTITIADMPDGSVSFDFDSRPPVIGEGANSTLTNAQYLGVVCMETLVKRVERVRKNTKATKA